MVCLFHAFEEWQLEIKKEGLPVRAQAEPKVLKKDKPAHRKQAWPELLGSRCPRHICCWVLLPQSPPGRLEPQVFSQEHGQDAAQVVYRGWVQVGLRVIGRVPDRGEGCGDEVEHRDPCRTERSLRLVRGPQLTQEPRPPSGEPCLVPPTAEDTLLWHLKNSEQ